MGLLQNQSYHRLISKALLYRTFSSKSGVYNVPNYPLNMGSSVTGSAPPTDTLQKADYNNIGRVRCYNCGQIGHISYDCRLPQVRKACYLCGNPGHVSRDCPQRVKVLACYNCRKTGHLSHECPDSKKSIENNSSGKSVNESTSHQESG